MTTKIAFIHNALDRRGGAERKLLLLARHVSRLPDVELEIFVMRYRPQDTFTEYLDGLTVREVPAEGLVAKLIALFRIAYRTRHADLVHAHNHPAQMAAVFSKMLRRKPIVWFDNEPLLYLEGTVRRNNMLKLRVLRFFERLLVPFIDKVVANSTFTAENIKKFLNRETVVIHSGVDTDMLSPDPGERVKKGSGAPHIVALSRFEKEKNLDLLIRLAEKERGVIWTIAGNGPEEAALCLAVKNCGLTHVNIVTGLSEEGKIALYRSGDVFAFPTLNEPLGITVVEAMSCGLPVVAFNSGGARETVVDGVTGFLVETQDVFAEKLHQLTLDGGMRQSMGTAARRRVIEHFSLNQMVRKTLDLYKKLLPSHVATFSTDTRTP